MNDPNEPQERTHGLIEQWLELDLSPQTKACLRSIVQRRELRRRDARIIIPFNDPATSPRPTDFSPDQEEPPRGEEP